MKDRKYLVWVGVATVDAAGNELAYTPTSTPIATLEERLLACELASLIHKLGTKKAECLVAFQAPLEPAIVCKETSYGDVSNNRTPRRPR